MPHCVITPQKFTQLKLNILKKSYDLIGFVDTGHLYKIYSFQNLAWESVCYFSFLVSYYDNRVKVLIWGKRVSYRIYENSHSLLEF
jgi:hypothetical protein